MTGRILPFAPLLAARPAEPRLTWAASGASGVPAVAADAAPLDPREAEQFRRLILPLMDSAYSFRRFLCRDASVAEDLVQDAFLRAFAGSGDSAAASPGPGCSPSCGSSYATWAQRRDETHPDPEAALQATPSEDPSPEAALVRQARPRPRAGDHGPARAVPRNPGAARIRGAELSRDRTRDRGPDGTVMSRLARARQMLLAALPLEELRP
jgi:RNA polymerase sigma-70 factor (ECF subfamily)